MHVMPPHVLERLRWSKLSEKVKRRLLNAVPNRAYYLIFKEMRREIVMKAHELGVPDRRLREHFEELQKEGVPKIKIGERMLADLEKAEQLAEATGVEPERFKKFLKEKSLSAALEEMEQHAEAMQGRQAAA